MKSMRFGRVILTIFLAIAVPKAARAVISIDRMCQAKKEYISAAKRSSIPIQQMVRSVVKDDTDVVFIGVEHGNFEREVYPQLVDLIHAKQPSANCFFMEESLGEADSRAISEFNQRVDGADSRLKARFEWAYELFSLLRNRGLAIHYVDFPGKDKMPFNSKDDIRKWLEARDEFMATHILAMKKSNECKVAIFPVGASHLVSAENRTNLKERLVKFGLKTSEILLLISGRNSAIQEVHNDYPLINPGLVWFRSPAKTLTPSADQLLCDENSEISEESYAFLNSPTRVPLVYMSDEGKFLGTLGEFQGTLIYSCEGEKCREENKVIEKSLRDQNVRLY